MRLWHAQSRGITTIAQLGAHLSPLPLLILIQMYLSFPCSHMDLGGCIHEIILNPHQWNSMLKGREPNLCSFQLSSYFHLINQQSQSQSPIGYTNQYSMQQLIQNKMDKGYLHNHNTVSVPNLLDFLSELNMNNPENQTMFKMGPKINAETLPACSINN